MTTTTSSCKCGHDYAITPSTAMPQDLDSLVVAISGYEPVSVQISLNENHEHFPEHWFLGAMLQHGRVITCGEITRIERLIGRITYCQSCNQLSFALLDAIPPPRQYAVA